MAASKRPDSADDRDDEPAGSAAGASFSTRPDSPRARVAHAEAPTIITRRRRGGPTASSASTQATAGGAGSQHASPVDALAIEEVERVRVFASLMLFVNVFGLIIIPFLGGYRPLRLVLMGALVLNFFSSAWVIRNAHATSPGRQLMLAVFATITAHAAILFWGPLTVAPVMLVLGLFFFGRAGHLPSVVVIYAIGAGGQAVWAVLALTGVMPDVGLAATHGTPVHVHIVAQVVLQFIFVSAYVLARETRKSTLRAIAGVLEARRQVAQREAMFEEVRQDLDRVLKIGGAGRHSEKELGGWHLGALIGRGAMGEVYEATSADGGIAAIKLLHPNVLANPGSIERFLREARAAGQLESPHAVRILGASDASAAVPYLVMERLHGHDLAHHLRRRRRLGRDRFDPLVRQVGAVLDEAGHKGIVHRDIKPQNLFLAETATDAMWKVLDFGASKLGEHSGTLTEGRVVGTPGYMAPEQARGEDVTPSADVYALAAIAYRCLTGRPPFSFREIHTCLYHVCYGMPPRPSLVAELPATVDAVLAVGLAKRASDRFASGGELAVALIAALDGAADAELETRAARLLAALPWGATPPPAAG